MILYRSGRETQAFIRVWRSLVSRLNGVQEASSSNLDTRTKKALNSKEFSAFLLLFYIKHDYPTIYAQQKSQHIAFIVALMAGRILRYSHVIYQGIIAKLEP